MTSPNQQPPGVDRGIGEDLARRMVDLYADTERRLAADIARRLAAGQDAPDWAQRKLAAIQELLRWARTLLARVEREAELEVTQAMLLAYMRGGTAALRGLAQAQNTLPEWLDLAGVVDPNPRIRAVLEGRRSQLSARLAELVRELPGLAALQRIIRSLVLKITGTHLPVLRWVEDTYREVIATSALPDVTLGLKTRLRASQVSWERLLSEGITGFVDRRGRRWNLASYVEMATRTGVAQAAVEGHMDRLADAKLDLVIVSNAPQECALCRVWEGKILARTGTPGRRRVQVRNVLTGRTETVVIAGTLAEAIAAGLLHPNCRHSISAYLHGATRVPTHTADPEGDKARQQLRYLERQVRKAKLKAAGAMTPDAKRDHERKARAWQARIREHVAATAHLGIRRKPERERIGAAR